MQDTFINVYQGLSKLENKVYFKTRLVRIMLNECYKKSQKLSSKKEIATDTFLNGKNITMFSASNSNTEKKV